MPRVKNVITLCRPISIHENIALVIKDYVLDCHFGQGGDCS